LRDGFLLFRDLQRLDRDGHLARLLVELGDAGIDLLAYRETKAIVEDRDERFDPDGQPRA
jgi:hypothetical protein